MEREFQRRLMMRNKMAFKNFGATSIEAGHIT
jgi:hypothetical protein